MVDKTKVKKKQKEVKQSKKEVKQTKKQEVKQPKKEVKQPKKEVKQPKKEEYIYNPDTKRNVKKNGDVGKKVLEKYGGGATALSLSCCRVTGTSTGNESKQSVAQTPVQAPAPAAQAAKTARLRTSLKCCQTRKSTESSHNTLPPTQDLSNCFKNNTNSPMNTFNSGLCFFINETEITAISTLSETLSHLNQSNSLKIDTKYTISKKNTNTKNANTNANTQTFEITITPPPKDPPNNSTNSPSGDCDININYDNNSNTVTITKVEAKKCGIVVNNNFFEKLAELIKQILNEILTEFVNIFESMTKVDVKGLVKGVFIAIIVDTIFEDLCKGNESNKPKICEYPKIKILINVAANNPTASPIQIVVKTTIGMVKASSGLSTLQDMIRKFYVTQYLEDLKAMFNLQSQTN